VVHKLLKSGTESYTKLLKSGTESSIFLRRSY